METVDFPREFCAAVLNHLESYMCKYFQLHSNYSGFHPLYLYLNLITSHVITVLLLTDAISEKSYFLLWLLAQKHLSVCDGLQNLQAPLV